MIMASYPSGRVQETSQSPHRVGRPPGRGHRSSRGLSGVSRYPTCLYGTPQSQDSPPRTRDQLIREIEEELTCTFCLGIFSEPKVLPCLHTYCKKCVARLVQGGGATLVCPQCRENHRLPEGGVDKFLTFFTFANLVKVLEIHKADGKALTCENGVDTNPAVARCLDCQAYLCQSCSHLHKQMVATKLHNVISLEEIRTKGEKCFQTPHHCPVHEKEVLKLYCRTCSTAICGDCTYVDHRSHNYVFIKDVHEELKGKLDNKLESMKKLSTEAKHKKEIAHNVVEVHEAKVASIRTSIDQTFAKLMEHVKNCHRRVIQNLEQQSQTRRKIHSANVEEAELAHARLTSLITFIERLLQSSDACEITTMANRALEQCRKLETSQKGEAEESCDWRLDGVEEALKSLQNITVRQQQVQPQFYQQSHHEQHRQSHRFRPWQQV